MEMGYERREVNELFVQYPVIFFLSVNNQQGKFFLIAQAFEN